MARRIFPLLLVTALCTIILIFAIWKSRSTIAPRTEAGAELAPNFTLKSLDGTPLRLSDYRGKVILLDFWATWCAPCQEEIPRFVEWQSKYQDRGLQVIGMSMDDSPEPVQKFGREFRMNYPVALETQDVASKYRGIFGLPVNIVIGRDGKIKAKHLGMYDLTLLKQELTSQLESKE
jgi:thiol-disulfide isomerase/thioredoxin